jgi:hypothetical protein
MLAWYDELLALTDSPLAALSRDGDTARANTMLNISDAADEERAQLRLRRHIVLDRIVVSAQRSNPPGLPVERTLSASPQAARLARLRREAHLRTAVAGCMARAGSASGPPTSSESKFRSRNTSSTPQPAKRCRSSRICSSEPRSRKAVAVGDGCLAQGGDASDDAAHGIERRARLLGGRADGYHPGADVLQGRPPAADPAAGAAQRWLVGCATRTATTQTAAMDGPPTRGPRCVTV